MRHPVHGFVQVQGGHTTGNGHWFQAALCALNFSNLNPAWKMFLSICQFFSWMLWNRILSFIWTIYCIYLHIFSRNKTYVNCFNVFFFHCLHVIYLLFSIEVVLNEYAYTIAITWYYFCKYLFYCTFDLSF